MKRLLLLLFGIAVSVGSLWYAMRDTDTNMVLHAFKTANYASLPPILLLLLAFYWLKSIRFAQLLAPAAPLTAGQLFPPVMIGFAANNILPAHLGEFVRVFVVNRQHRIPAGTVLSSIVLERIFDIFSILALFGLGILFAPSMPENYQRGGMIAAAVAAAVVLVMIVYMVRTDWFVTTTARAFRLFPFIPGWLTEKILDLLRQGAIGLHSLKSARAILSIAINSLIQWLINGYSACLALEAFGIDVTLSTGLILTGITALGVMIPAAPGYFGVVQVCFQIAVQVQQIKPDPSLVLAASLYSQIVGYIAVTGIGVFCLNRAHLSLKDLQQAADSNP
jgi:uncharacterized protein (TIRG00374 family)